MCVFLNIQNDADDLQSFPFIYILEEMQLCMWIISFTLCSEVEERRSPPERFSGNAFG